MATESLPAWDELWSEQSMGPYHIYITCCGISVYVFNLDESQDKRSLWTIYNDILENHLSAETPAVWAKHVINNSLVYTGNEKIQA